MNERMSVPDSGGSAVVVGTDFSAAAARAMAEARSLAQRLGAPLQVVHVADGFHVRSWEPLVDNAQWLAEAGIPPESVVVRYGVPWVELVRHAEQDRSLLLVAGSHGASGSHSMALGTTASRLATQARCPVLLVSTRVKAPNRNGKADRDMAAALTRQTRESTMETDQ
ncbi:MAG: universal stress protein [Gemmatimonadota bacterium]